MDGQGCCAGPRMGTGTVSGCLHTLPCSHPRVTFKLSSLKVPLRGSCWLYGMHPRCALWPRGCTLELDRSLSHHHS